MQLAKTTDTYSVSFDNTVEAAVEYSLEQSKTVLLIDDEEIVLDVMEMMLEKLEYKVLKAQCGFEGLQLFKKNQFKIDLIISDMNMPEMDGKEFMQKLREIDPDTKVMLSSGALTDKDEQDVMNNGFDGFISKPYNMNNLSEKMAEILH
jgi:CheY-like chemotaxis protein